MTLISRMGYTPVKKAQLIAPCLTQSKEITVVIPVKNNQDGINHFLKQFFHTHPPSLYPNAIIIVDNNSTPPLAIHEQYPALVKVCVCTKPGPAAARNMGAALATTDWILFTDSDCIPTGTFLTGYFKAQNGSIGYAGNIKALKNGLLSKYYESQEILLPPEVNTQSQTPTPDYLITANCLVWKPAFGQSGGFNETFLLAAGEDIDLGFRLREIGGLAYALDSVAIHNFEEDIPSFRKRFRRYGTGNRKLAELYQLDLTPRLFGPNKKSLVNYILALLQFLSLRKGYYQA